MPADVHAVVRKQFGAAAGDYANAAVHISGPDLDALLQAAALTGTERVLDVGCGAGHTTIAVARHAAHVTGVDVTAEMLAQARDQAVRRSVTNVTFEEADACSLPYADASFDLVTCRFAAHHYADAATSVREAARVLQPGGRYLLVDSVAPEDAGLDTFENLIEYLRDASHVRNWRASEWCRMFEGAGLTAEVVYRAGLALDGDNWTKRMRTPPAKVAMIRELFAEATPQQRTAFELRDDPWGFSLPVALIAGTKQG